MKVAVLFSGGKDSCLATWYALHKGWSVDSLLVAYPSIDSWMFHYPAVEWASLQGEAIGIPVKTFKASSGKESELQSLYESLVEMKKQDGLDGLVSGAIGSGYQKRKVDMICDAVKIPSFSPLWFKEPEFLLEEMLNLGFETYVTGVSALGLDEMWLGRRLDETAISELKRLALQYGIHLSGEGGEYETFVADAGFFRKRISFKRTSKHWNGSSGFLAIHEAELTGKL